MQETRVWSLIQEDPHATEQLSPWAITTEPCALEPGNHNSWALCSRAQEPQPLKHAHPTALALQQEKSLQWKTCALQLESSPHLPQLKKNLCSNEDSE